MTAPENYLNYTIKPGPILRLMWRCSGSSEGPPNTKVDDVEGGGKEVEGRAENRKLIIPF